MKKSWCSVLIIKENRARGLKKEAEKIKLLLSNQMWWLQHSKWTQGILLLNMITCNPHRAQTHTYQIWLILTVIENGWEDTMFLSVILLKSLHFMSLSKKTSNRSFTNSLSVVVPTAILFNLHRRSCAAGFVVVVDSCRQRRKRMASSCLLEMSGPDNARLLSRMKPAGCCGDSAGDNPSRIQAASPSLLLSGTESFLLCSKPWCAQNHKFYHAAPPLVDMAQNTSFEKDSVYSFCNSLKILLLHWKSEHVPKNCNRT